MYLFITIYKQGSNVNTLTLHSAVDKKKVTLPLQI